MSSSPFESLPGVPLPVADVTDRLSEMWQSNDDDGPKALSEFRASQMNLIILFGRLTSVGEALAQFEIAMRFAERYPCRIIILCPITDKSSDKQLKGKLYAQCYMGASQNAKTCSETLILGYTSEQVDFLENQVSTWLESDLPLYLWLHKASIRRLIKSFSTFFKASRRVVYDYSLEGDTYNKIKWPDYVTVRDLSYSRTLPMRQSIGQFISAYPPEVLVKGLEKVEIRYIAEREGEGRELLAWHRSSFDACAKQSGVQSDKK